MKRTMYLAVTVSGMAFLFALVQTPVYPGPFQEAPARDQRDVDQEIEDERYQSLDDKRRYEERIAQQLDVIEETIEELADTPETETTDQLAQRGEAVRSLEKLLSGAREELGRLEGAEGSSWHRIRRSLESRVSILNGTLGTERTRFRE